MYNLHIIYHGQNTYSFVGSVPNVLAYVNSDGSPVSDETVESQMRLPSNMRTIKTRFFSTRQAAFDEATRLGLQVKLGECLK